MSRNDWLKDLYCLACRVEGLGATPDLAGLSLCELWGLYCYLRRLLEN